MKTNKIVAGLIAGIAGLSMSAAFAGGPKDIKGKEAKEMKPHEAREFDKKAEELRERGEGAETKALTNGLDASVKSVDTNVGVSRSQSRHLDSQFFSLSNSCGKGVASTIAGELKAVSSNFTSNIITSLGNAEAAAGLSQTIILNGKEMNMKDLRLNTAESENDPAFKQGYDLVLQWKENGIHEVMNSTDKAIVEIREACKGGNAAACEKEDTLAYELGVEKEIIARIGKDGAEEFKPCATGYGLRRAA